ncbi:hypothetical protein BO86DRAFT_386971 [Aspergillus japonicus CBS 114.51]|uniref:Clr5 domain-containing protein n=1 Tax=Aspergillus japonicus CBS 114.51 TaxID=1448312 RepID=A0A8T8X841_ASPJA|nr:hypothetical protein BO86DRAFT_386971 [Aspergillus japonicus CBS 114.51]RAH84337.1 hypothetical protein BO86DRAFT_386971 [Aspergillus japonicus CBS 114.51]
MALAAHQSIIRKLYCDENMTLGDLREYMEREIGIRASKDTYKRWFRKWGLCKNRRGDIWTWASHRIEKRKAGQGNKETEVHFNGTVIDHKRVQKEIARHVSTMDRIEARAPALLPHRAIASLRPWDQLLICRIPPTQLPSMDIKFWRRPDRTTSNRAV